MELHTGREVYYTGGKSSTLKGTELRECVDSLENQAWYHYNAVTVKVSHSLSKH